MSSPGLAMRAGMILAAAIFMASFVVPFLRESLQSFAYDGGQSTLNQDTAYQSWLRSATGAHVDSL
jgi:hypothetical protein